jgi:hypothetical protein
MSPQAIGPLKVGPAVDELGYLTFDARGADLLYQVFNRRY